MMQCGNCKHWSPMYCRLDGSKREKTSLCNAWEASKSWELVERMLEEKPEQSSNPGYKVVMEVLEVQGDYAFVLPDHEQVAEPQAHWARKGHPMHKALTIVLESIKRMRE